MRRGIGWRATRAARAVRLLAPTSATPSDVRRWQNPRSYDQQWQSTNAVVASLIPAKSRVLDLGAGQQHLRGLLGPDCTYIAADLAGHDQTLRCDLNERPLPDFASLAVTVCVLSGVLEYVNSIPELARWLAGVAPTVIASYECATPVGGQPIFVFRRDTA